MVLQFLHRLPSVVIATGASALATVVVRFSSNQVIFATLSLTFRSVHIPHPSEKSRRVGNLLLPRTVFCKFARGNESNQASRSLSHLCARLSTYQATELGGSSQRAGAPDS